MLEISPGWECDVARGPDWLLVKINRPVANAADTPRLADRIWSLLQQQFTCRLVLELDQIGVLDEDLIRELVQLHDRIAARDGVMRLCGLSPRNETLLRASHLDGRFPPYGKRRDAVFGRYRPQQPR